MDPNQIDPEKLVTLVEQRAWVPLAALVIMIAVRLLKSDTKFFPTIPPRVRIWVVIGLGIASSVLEHVAGGKSWTSALIGGAVSVAMAVMFHETVIASARAGKEIPLPTAVMIVGARPSPAAPVTVLAPGAKQEPVVVMPLPDDADTPPAVDKTPPAP